MTPEEKEKAEAEATEAKAKAAKAARRFVIKTPNAGFNGERHGVAFLNGVGETDDARKAHAMLEYAYEVTDKATGKHAWPKEQAQKSGG